jgi:hypothetical protein
MSTDTHAATPHYTIAGFPWGPPGRPGCKRTLTMRDFRLIASDGRLTYHANRWTYRNTCPSIRKSAFHNLAHDFREVFFKFFHTHFVDPIDYVFQNLLVLGRHIADPCTEIDQRIHD